ncbi:GNAT family N-acetyltransferase [Pontibacillus sp. ALD_SL1]|nr:GNAT family N-acetyltransferase [Pontibacillus sp. ALD_SL1]
MYSSLPNERVITELNRLHAKIFNDDIDLTPKMESKRKLLTIIAINKNEEIVGYKMGYELDDETFYSWLGGVDPKFRNQGIASELLNRQHDYLMTRGYKTVQTKTLNKWKGMLILNLKNGFDVKSTYRDEKGMYKIILEKEL